MKTGYNTTCYSKQCKCEALSEKGRIVFKSKCVGIENGYPVIEIKAVDYGEAPVCVNCDKPWKLLNIKGSVSQIKEIER